LVESVGPDEARVFENGNFELVTLGSAVVGRATYAPGWKRSTRVAPIAGRLPVARSNLSVSSFRDVRVA